MLHSLGSVTQIDFGCVTPISQGNIELSIWVWLMVMPVISVVIVIVGVILQQSVGVVLHQSVGALLS